MKIKLAAERLRKLGACAGCALPALGAAQAAVPPDVVIATPVEALAFNDAAPFEFRGQALVVDAGFASSRAVTLHKLAPVFVGDDAYFELNGVLSSAAAPMMAPLEKRGPGTLALRGANTYTSNTALREGRLRLAGEAAAGSGVYTLQQHAGTVLELEPGARVLNFVQVGATRPGDTPLPGLEGVAEWRVEAGTATLANTVGTQVPLRKAGDGTLRLARPLQGTADVVVEAGALALDGAATMPVEVLGGARLEGAGRVARAHIRAGGMLAPGGREAAATLTVWGDVAFDADGVFHVNAYDDGRADLLDVGGTAALGGRVWAEAGAGEWAAEQRYRILRTGGGLGDSRFEGVDANLAFLDPELDYDAGNVYLTLRRNDVGVGDVGEIPDDEEVGDVIDPPEPPKEPPGEPKPPVPPGEPQPEPGPEPQPEEPVPPRPEPETPQPPAEPEPQPETPADTGGDDAALPPEPDEPGRVVADMPGPSLRDVVLGMTREQARSALRQMSGSWHASVRSFLVDDGRHVRQAVLASAADAWGDTPAAMADGSGRQSGEAADGAPPGLVLHGLRTWAQTYVATGRRDAADGVAGDRHESRGMVLGLDAPLGRHWRPGLVLAAQHAQLRRSQGPASAAFHSLHAGFSAHGRRDTWRMTVAVLRAWHRVESRRRVSAGRLQEALGVSYAGRSWHGVVEIATHLRGFAPYLRYEWARLKLPAFEESGGLSAHGVEASRTTMRTTTLGLRARHDWQWQGWPAWLDADLGWRRTWGDTRVIGTQRFMGEAAAGHASKPFGSQGRHLPRNTLAASLSANFQPSRNTRFSLRYATLLGTGHQAHTAWADFRWAF